MIKYESYSNSIVVNTVVVVKIQYMNVSRMSHMKKSLVCCNTMHVVQIVHIVHALYSHNIQIT